MAKNNDVASVLAFEKKLVPSDGYFYGTSWDHKSQCTPLVLQEKSVRGTISNRLKGPVKNDPLKLNAEVEKANLQTVDACALGTQQDTLKHQFTLKILGGVETPSACNNASFKESYTKAAKEYIAREGFRELGRRYAHNIANARFLWRNRVGAEKIEVEVKVLNKGQEQQWTFDATQYSIRSFEKQDDKVNELGAKIAAALANSEGALLLEITTYAQLGQSQEVYPSEELVLDKGKGDKSKILYHVNGHAAMHSQKIGNALRSIDTWYPDYNDEVNSAGAIAIEPYGAVTNLGRAYRTPSDKQDFYTHFDKWARGEKLARLEDEHYVMAVLVRGGVFGESDK
ncbi:TPA: type I-F CRISPR-associated protein Csy3 [Providencia stuartii]|uniref:Type I-F CRISPR-associated protein Csy3 n=3 Tax=Providencia stuartii TaxID=588 RepID=A0AAJ1JCI2_PROST|nr:MULTISPECIES: type I-F CRISPR-associated protein Csy3 [Providencia]SST02693.1 CRISPR-associated protein (Cas_Csy3) family protein [Acinetobacter baumannii]AFH95466.1 CRISPR-associated Csy3 family protein [Providencia stuartii MRSN 2154]AIN64309.1 CRISPR-associated family protein [Providencia stuartii]AMG66388.1 type I-F CRISPR-associated protein Csy3 [Providencia stuartii]APG49522.1 type I-F CRISPR-associated protein Csy3 [Providencia stuartii]